MKKSKRLAENCREYGIKINNAKSKTSTSARRRRLSDQVEDAESEIKYWTQ